MNKWKMIKTSKSHFPNARELRAPMVQSMRAIGPRDPDLVVNALVDYPVIWNWLLTAVTLNLSYFFLSFVCLFYFVWNICHHCNLNALVDYPVVWNWLLTAANFHFLGFVAYTYLCLKYLWSSHGNLNSLCWLPRHMELISYGSTTYHSFFVIVPLLYIFVWNIFHHCNLNYPIQNLFALAFDTFLVISTFLRRERLLRVYLVFITRWNLIFLFGRLNPAILRFSQWQTLFTQLSSSSPHCSSTSLEAPLQSSSMTKR